ncbi:unnamed protein product [Soboliphyme baturini]|uniref:Protein VAC14 homolog n=1 Tax=Soboliphyme baturini TaxID=241478 RepID=A0A183IKI9_9BILA|nr:unnamed protein product [Soboliphyme baturini]
MAEPLLVPIPSSMLRQLTDKMYEKRKAAALELEKLVRESVRMNQMDAVEKMISMMSELVNSPTPHVRKGGLLGLAAIAIALGNPLNPIYACNLIMPVLSCVLDAEGRVRYYACESLYNIMKVTREMALLKFDDLFDALCKVSRHSGKFEVGKFMALLRERIYTQNEFVKCFLIMWFLQVQTLQNNPDMKLVSYVSDILDGIFHILADPSKLTRTVCLSVLDGFLQTILDQPIEADVECMVNVLVVNAQSKGELKVALNLPLIIAVLQSNLSSVAVPTKIAALHWIRCLYTQMPTQVSMHMSDLFPSLLQSLSDPSDEVSVGIHSVNTKCSITLASLGLSNLTQASLTDISPYFVKFIISLLEEFRRDDELLLNRGAFIVRQLCIWLKPEDTFRTFAVLLNAEDDVIFVAQLVRILSSTLLTAPELFSLRQRLQNNKDKESLKLFGCLYTCWSYEPVSLLALCLLTQNYAHAADLVERLYVYFTSGFKNEKYDSSIHWCTCRSLLFLLGITL